MNAVRPALWPSLCLLAVCFMVSSCETTCPYAGPPYVPAYQFDVVVVGATPAGIAAALNAAREGQRVALIEESRHIGGMTAGGLSHADFLTEESVGGTWREFMDRIERHYIDQYGADSQQVKDCMHGANFEPKAARAVFEAMLKEQPGVTLFLRHRLHEAVLVTTPDDRKRITAVRALNLDVREEPYHFDGKVFIDATYEGDLMAAAGCRYRIGRESKSEYGESLAPDASDSRVMAYNFRLTLTDDPAIKLPIPKPENYDPQNYSALFESIRRGDIQDLSDIIEAQPLPNRKFDIDGAPGVSAGIELISESGEWPGGSPEDRARLFQLARDQALGLFHTLLNNPEVPARIRDRAAEYGLPRDEYVDTAHWTPALYVREGRRMTGDTVFTQHDAEAAPGSVRAPARRDSIAIGDSPLNAHAVIGNAIARPDGAFSSPTRPWQVPYAVMLPREVEGLLVPVAVSASHVGYSAIRTEPAWTALGQAAGLAAAQSIETGVSLRELDVTKLQRRLHERGALTFYAPDVPPGSSSFMAVQYFGNLGLFQQMTNPSSTSGAEPLASSRMSWKQAFPDHAIEPAKPLDEALYNQWLVMLPPDLADAARMIPPDGKLTRGDFLNRLYEAAFNEAPDRPLAAK
ncbi:MAG: FAD-dependent oxidoreductase [bacterium]|nr:FAD-dependent oxidoreductase [bacterium]